MSRSVEVIGVPLDLGANMRGANMGPSAIRIAGLFEQIRALEIDAFDHGDIRVPVREQLSEEDCADKYRLPIFRACDELRAAVLGCLNKDRVPITIGGDHSIAIGSITGAAEYCKAQEKELGLIWIDAHADLNNPQISPSNNIHGMPLSTLLGDGYSELVNLGYEGAKIKPENVALIGIRNIDGHEREQVKASGIRYYTMRDIDERGIFKIMQEVVTTVGIKCDALHVSFDIDGIDPLYAPGVSTAVTGGLSCREAHLALEMISDTNKLMSADVVELNPVRDQDHKTATLAVELVTSMLGKSIV